MSSVLNSIENGPAVPLGEPPDARPVGFPEACEQFVGHCRRAFLGDGIQPDEMRIIAATFQSVKMLMREAIARQSAGGAAGAPGEFQPPAGPSNETQDFGTAQGAVPLED